MNLWDWAVAVYARPQAQALCLTLQDDQSQCVPYLLWAAWLARSGRAASPAVLAEAAALSQAWETGATGPLRQVRRWLTGQGAEVLRDQVKAAELQSEGLLMARLETLGAAGGLPASLTDALIAASAAWGRPAKRASLAALADVIA